MVLPAHLALVTVCDKCLRASCWQGTFLCDNAAIAGTIQMSKADLFALNLEHWGYWDLPKQEAQWNYPPEKK